MGFPFEHGLHSTLIPKLAREQAARELAAGGRERERPAGLTERELSTRAAATLFAMEHGLVAWGERPISRLATKS